MTRVLLSFTLAAALLLLPVAADAQGSRSTQPRSSVTSSRLGPAAARRAALAALAAREPVALATSLAERYWGAVPCAGQIAVRAEQPPAVGVDSTTDGWATFESSLGANDLEAPASTYTQCTISLAAWQWPTRLEIAADWNMFCLTVTHEMGHLLGHPHSLTPGSVMAPVFTDESDVPAICRAARGPVEAAAGLTQTH
jgi:hypothetical protein